MMGAVPGDGGTRFAVHSTADRVWLCLFDGDAETRFEMERHDGIFSLTHPAAPPGTRYGLRVEGPYDPDAGLWFDPAKLLIDPYAMAIDRPFRHDPALAVPRADAIDTALLMPKGIVTALPPPPPPRAPIFDPAGLIYEVAVRAFSMRHPDVPAHQRGTIAALAHPVVIDHLRALGVSAVELMPITAWIDERHLPPLGLSNAWGYNPVSFMALDPRIAPGGLAELRATVAALHAAGIGCILDVVMNHTGESDRLGPTLSLRGLDGRGYFNHAADGTLINDTGCGNTLGCDHPVTIRLMLDALRHFVIHAGVDGFRFDLAPILGRDADGFFPRNGLLGAIMADPLLGDRVLIAEPWDIGPGGYQLGRFAAPMLEWNDRYRDDVRRWWRGDGGTGAFVTRVAGSSDIFAPPATRTVNFVAAHDGFTLADLVAHSHRHNLANGEDNRDGHSENFSWNNGAEGASDDPAIADARRRDAIALLATLFASRGAIMLTAGDEFGRTQSGNNNAYAQDNAVTWLDWAGRDLVIEAAARALASIRRAYPMLAGPDLLTGEPDGHGVRDVVWLNPAGEAMTEADWHGPADSFAMLIASSGIRLAILFNRADADRPFALPGTWRALFGTIDPLLARSIAIAIEKPS